MTEFSKTNDESYRIAMGRLLVMYTQVDNLIMRACAERIATAPSDEIRIMLGKQVGDESKHVRIQHEWMEKFGTDRSPVFAERQQEMFLQHFRSLNWLDFLTDMYVCVEALGSEAVEQIVPMADPGTRESLRTPLEDEIEQVEQTRDQLPPLLKEVEAVRKELPAVLKSADKASNAIVVMSKEIEATRPLVPQVLKEIETTRESIPPMLDRADAMIDKARTAGKEASSGAVTGFFKGLITAPFTLVGDAGKAITGMSDDEIKQLTEKDLDLIETTALYLLNNGVKGEAKEISNPDSGFSATLKVVSESTSEDDFTTVECRTMFYDGYKNGKRLKTVNRTFCKEQGGGWDFDE